MVPSRINSAVTAVIAAGLKPLAAVIADRLIGPLRRSWFRTSLRLRARAVP